MVESFVLWLNMQINHSQLRHVSKYFQWDRNQFYLHTFQNLLSWCDWGWKARFTIDFTVGENIKWTETTKENEKFWLFVPFLKSWKKLWIGKSLWWHTNSSLISCSFLSGFLCPPLHFYLVKRILIRFTMNLYSLTQFNTQIEVTFFISTNYHLHWTCIKFILSHKLLPRV